MTDLYLILLRTDTTVVVLVPPHISVVLRLQWPLTNPLYRPKRLARKNAS